MESRIPTGTLNKNVQEYVRGEIGRIQKEQNKWKNIPYSSKGSIHILKIPNLPKSENKYNIILISNTFLDTDKLIQKFM